MECAFAAVDNNPRCLVCTLMKPSAYKNSTQGYFRFLLVFSPEFNSAQDRLGNRVCIFSGKVELYYQSANVASSLWPSAKPHWPNNFLFVWSWPMPSKMELSPVRVTECKVACYIVLRPTAPSRHQDEAPSPTICSYPYDASNYIMA